jgi:hypothetical protein
MAISRLTLPQRVTTVLVCLAVMPISFAGYVYTWNTIAATDLDISGSIEFADTIEFGDAVTDIADVVGFSYSIVKSIADIDYGAAFGIDDVYISRAILVEEAGLGSGNAVKKKAKRKTKKKAKRKAKRKTKKKAATSATTMAVTYTPGPISLDGDPGYIEFDVGSDLSWIISEGFLALNDLTPEPILDDEIYDGGGEAKRKTKKKAAKRKVKVTVDPTGIEGRWDTTTALPEPSSFALLLGGFFAVGAMIRRRLGRT